MRGINQFKIASERLNFPVTKNRTGRSFAARLAMAAVVCVGAASSAAFSQTAQFSYAIQTLGGGFSSAYGVAVDGKGNVYVGDTGNNQVKEMPSGCTSSSCVTTLGGGFSSPYGVAVDGGGNVYVADLVNNAVKEIPFGCTSSSCVTTLGGGFDEPISVAVDGNGNVYVADGRNNAVKEIPSGCMLSSCVTTLGGGFSEPAGVAVDGNGNVYVADQGNFAIKEMPPGCTSLSCVTTLAGGSNGTGSIFHYPTGVVVDGSGNVYVADNGFGKVQEIPSGCASPSCVTTLGASSLVGTSVAVDDSGNVYVAAYSDSAVKMLLPRTRGVPLPNTPVGQSSQSPVLTFTFDTGGSIAAPVVLTEGATGKDFTDTGTGSCTTPGPTWIYSQGSLCTVQVTFSPKVAGLRRGAVELTTNTGTVIATAYVYGIGTGPQVIFSPGTASTLGGSYTFISPEGIAVDGSGNVYVADTSFKAVEEIPPGCTSSSCVAALGGGFDLITSVAVDGAGNVYVADNSGNGVDEMPPGCASSSCVTALGGGFKFPSGVAVDGAGNVYVADSGNNAVKEMPPGCTSSSCVITLGGTLSSQSIAVDASGNVYVANGNVVEMPPGCASSSCVTTLGVGGGSLNAFGIAVDASGNVYFSDTSYNGVKEIPPGCMSSSCITTLPGGFPSPFGIALDGSGNVYVVNYLLSQINAVMKLDRADPPSLSFAATAVGSTSTDSPQTVTLANIGNEALTFPTPASGQNPSIPPDFSLENTSTCPVLSSSSALATLAPASACTLAVSFTPKSPGIVGGSLVVTDNNLNVPAAKQTVALSGTGTGVDTPTVTVNSQTIVYLASAAQLTASIAYTRSTAPTGTVTFTLAGATFTGTCAAAASVRSCSVIVPTSGLAPGSYPITVSEAADDNYPPASGTGTLTVNSQTPTVAVSSLSVVQGTSTANLTASIAYTGSTAPTGAVTFTLTGVNGADYTGTCTVAASIRTCSATANTSTLTVGSYTIEVDEAADADYPSARGLGVLTITLVPAQTPKIILPSQIAFQGSETVTATITYTGSTAPVGAVAFFVNSTQYGASCTVAGSVRTCSTSFGSILEPGVYTVFVQEAADINFASASASGTLTVTNGAQTPVITVGSPSIVQGTSTAKLTASFAYVGSTAPTGAVNFGFNGVNYAGACTVASSVRSCSVTVPTSSLTPGGYIIEVTEAADANFLATFGETLLTVTSSTANIPTVAVRSLSVVQGTSSANLMASITYAGSTAPTGPVTFTLNGTSYTGICTLAASVRSCSATAATASLAPGSYPIAVTEAADANYTAASGSGMLTVTPAPSFKLIATPNSETIRRGDQAVFLLEVQSEHGFSGDVKLICSGGPSDSVCRDFPRTVKLEPNKRAQAISGIRFPRDTPRGTYTLTFTGTSCGIVVSTMARFKVEDSPYGPARFRRF
ncbi:MAG: SBBP repeat-containing protein [Terracidiphilus sp.]